ncbi:hypothetical protein EI42_03501 [Thermosporothrix hazakensis]|uniref:Prenyltransferase/squalene oxidase-like repeat protein n=1 Tax=Thermosporothrix hazakensis TaxID=644383 RepID=A0A326U502_THEHA|nr:hypothetical protein [Thermosporothrix hazakensis]PZW27415.1 hypothetical protein EI42_03501 [Thermosporothrix hazakensis]GCE45582.1 hypothetical protein KTH_04510 [Thermosporothrix hazakensis]
MHARLEKAYHFITQNGRPIDQARFAYHFMRTDASQDALLNTLSQYQNTDGGFGHGLEPDIGQQSLCDRACASDLSSGQCAT